MNIFDSHIPKNLLNYIYIADLTKAEKGNNHTKKIPDQESNL